MKNRTKSIICLLLMATMLCAFSFSTIAIGLPDEDYTDIEIRINLLSSNETEYSVIGSRYLYDSDGTPTYTYYELSPYGYAVYNNYTGHFEQLSYYSLTSPYSLNNNIDYYYFGPNNYVAHTELGFVDIQSGKLITSQQFDVLKQVETQKEAIEAFRLSTSASNSTTRAKPIIPTPIVTTIDYEITNSDYFTSPSMLGNSYALNSAGTCTVVSAVNLLSYYDVYVNDSYVADQYRSGYGTTTAFHNYLFYLITGDYNYRPVGYGDTSIALNNYLNQRGLNTLAVCYLNDNWTFIYCAHEQLEDYDRPVMGAYFESYGADTNHSVIIYGYMEMYEDGDCVEMYYKVYNGWRGSPDNLETVNTSWFADIIYFQ